MPVSGFNHTVIDPQQQQQNTLPTSSSVSTSTTTMAGTISNCSSNCSTPSPTNSLPHSSQNGQLMECNGTSNGPSLKLSLSSSSSHPPPLSSSVLREPDSNLMDDFSNHLSISPRPPLDREKSEMSTCLSLFDGWCQMRQSEFVEQIIGRMSFHQHERLYSILIPLLQRDFITALPAKGLHHVAYKILSYLDSQSLCRAELVCTDWFRVVADGMLWKKLINRKVSSDPVWKGLSIRRGWGIYLNNQATPPTEHTSHDYFRRLYPCIIQDIRNMEDNWRNGRQALTRIECHSENSKGVYCLQYDEKHIVSGLRDNTIKVWRRDTMECTKVLTGHTGSVLCLQYDDQVIVTGSSDSTIRVWDVESGLMLNTLVHHCEAVLHLRFNNETMVTCSKDRTIAVWDMRTPSDVVLRRVLVGHRAAVNVVDFDDRYIVSASGDRTIKVWQTNNCEFVRTLHGHRRGIACLQYRGNHVVSGSSDNTIRIWDVECGSCLRLLEGHEELVRCIRFDDKRIVSGAYDGTIKVWDLKAALDPRTPASNLCLKTLSEHTGRVFRLQFDDFQIVSSSHDDTILIWDFLDSSPPDPMEVDDTQEDVGEDEGREIEESPRRNNRGLPLRDSSEDLDSPTGDDIHFPFPEDGGEEGGSPSLNDVDHLSLSDH